ncbi:hypothetical protein DFP72DRAFT_389648 [Ephemerocybe angulata]|uniref:Uncharacterized protein n=1 Tax=Ephemerocybe angulata TaxID=980116 RepID=A0A8H6HVR3_9AGAR|nr:hypothetical protein DFP72DRAFT_389648 [Tulosesus angulatus]
MFPTSVCAGSLAHRPQSQRNDSRLATPVPGVSHIPQTRQNSRWRLRAINDVETRGKHGGEREALPSWRTRRAPSFSQLNYDLPRFPDAEITRFRPLAAEDARRRNAGYIHDAGMDFERQHTLTSIAPQPHFPDFDTSSFGILRVLATLSHVV